MRLLESECKDLKATFASLAMVEKSDAWNVFAQVGPFSSLGNRKFFAGIPGADHTCVWKSGRMYLITTEPYRTATHNHELLRKFCREYGWGIVKSTYPGWWNPPRTELFMLCPPKIGLDLLEVIECRLKFYMERNNVGRFGCLLRKINHAEAA